MSDLTQPLSDDELDELDAALLDRYDHYAEAEAGDDEGIIEACELDGFLTAIVSVPVTLLPSDWWPEVWGDFPPVADSDEALERLFSLTFRHSNSIVAMLLEYPDEFQPLFEHRTIDETSYVIVDEWCDGYMRGVELAVAHGAYLDDEAEALLHPIRAFTEAANWFGHDQPDAEVERLKQSIAPNVCALHSYWLARRQDTGRPGSEPFRRSTPRVGRNDPCPCGSGRKYKKCCLH